MSSAPPARVFGWIEPRYSKRTGLWNARYRYRIPGIPKPETIDHWHENEEQAIEAAQQTQLEKTLELREGMQAGLGTTALRQRTTVGQFVDGDWMAKRYPNLPPSSQESDMAAIRKWIRPFLGGRTFGEINKHMIQEWVYWMQREGAGIPTIERAVAVFRGLRKRAILWGYLADDQPDPCKGVELPEAPFEEEPAYALSMVEVERIGMKMPTLDDYFYTLLMGEEGLRGQEVIPLNWADLLHEDGSVRDKFRVVKAVSGAGRKRVIKDLKTSTGRRLPTFFAPVQEVAVALWEAQGEPALTQRIFPARRSHDGMIELRNWRDRTFFPALAAAGIPRYGETYGRLRPHSLRAAAASALGYALWPNAEMIGFLGHAQETTTVKYYERAIESAPQELRGMSVEDQILRARKIVSSS